jgi:hypothetical protein
MKSQWLALIVATLVLVGHLHAQDYAFKVLVNKGKNELKSGETWQQIKVGSALQSHDELRVAENSYIGLVHKTGKPLELKQSGKYKVMDLAAKVTGGPSVLNKYTDFILSANTGPKTNLAATGAVDRGLGNIQVHLPKPELAVVYNNNVTISWEEDKAIKPYVVVFKSMFGDELNTVETSDNHVTVNLDDKNFVNEDNIIVTVYSKTDKSKVSDEYTLKKLSKADKERIKSLLNEIAADTSEPNAFNKFILAGFYEQNGLLIDATSYFLEAIKLAPDVTNYKEDYDAFLLRHNIKKLPQKK